VTGGAGFIGSNVVDRYIRDGHEVTVLDDLSTGEFCNLHPDAVFCELDIRDRKAVLALLDAGAFEVVNHHAAQMDVRRSVKDPVFDAEVNIVGSLNLIQGAIRSGVRKMIYISTGGAVYGEPRSLPVKEDDSINPECPYGITKHTVEHYLYLYRMLEGLDYTVLRYPNVYGPRQSPKGEAGVIAIFAGLMLEGKTPTVYGNGDPQRDYVYVEDVAGANVLALTKAAGEIVNLGSEKGTSVMELYRRIAELTGFTGDPALAPLRRGEIEKIFLTGEKAFEVLGWQATTSVADGLARTVDWVRGVREGGSWQEKRC